MMGRLRAMREPLKYVQGRDALLKEYFLRRFKPIYKAFSFS
jgi:hypothetical protein